MYQYRLYNYEEIEKLNRDLEVYKKAIETWNQSESVLYMEAQQELEATKQELAKYKGEMKVMEETYQKQIQGYEQKEQKVAAQIHAINHSIQQLKKDVHSIKDDVKEIRINELLEKVDQIIGHTDTELHEVKKQIDAQKHVFTQVKNQPQPEKQQQRTRRRTSEYRRLHSMLKAAKPKSHVTPPPSNRTMTNPKRRRPSTDTNMITVQNGKKVFHNAKYELNKNIIVKKKTANKEPKNEVKNKEKVKEENEEKNIQQVQQVEEPKTRVSNLPSEPKEQESAVSREPQKQEPIVEPKPRKPEPSTVEPEQKSVAHKQEAKTTQEENTSPSGIKKTWLLAKSLWKK
jgi:hypothetical protein